MTRHVVVVCTGNVARSPALAQLLAAERPDLAVSSAAVGRQARPGRRMARPMRELLTRAGHGDYAEHHRSQLLTDLVAAGPVDAVVACAGVHLDRITELSRAAGLGVREVLPVLAVDPPLPDPAFGGPAAYTRVWPLIGRAAAWLAATLPPDDGRVGDAITWISERQLPQRTHAPEEAGDGGGEERGEEVEHRADHRRHEPRPKQQPQHEQGDRRQQRGPDELAETAPGGPAGTGDQ